MDKKSHRRLSLYEVLREEFLLLYGHLPPDAEPDARSDAGAKDPLHDTLTNEEAVAEAAIRRREREAAELSRVFSFIHHLPKKRSALCLSGRDGRSVAYTLGVLQGLAERELLPEFDYLSTAGGGSCVGGWLASWVEQHPEGLKGVCDELKERRRAPFAPEPEPVRRLRANRERLDTRARFLFADPWVSALLYLRNLLLNLLVLLPLIAAVLCLPRLFAAVLNLVPSGAVREAMLLASLALALVASSAFDYFGGKVRYRHWFTGGGRSILSQAYPLLPAAYMALWWGWQGSDLKDDGAISLMGQRGPALIFFILYGMMLNGWPPSRVNLPEGKKAARNRVYFWLWGLVGSIVGGAVCWVVATLLLPRAWASESVPWSFGYYVCLSVPVFLTPLVVKPLVYHRLTGEEWESSLRLVKAALVAALTWGGVSTLVIFGPVFLVYAAGSAILIALVVGLLVFVLGDATAALARGRRVAGRLWRSVTASGIGATLSSIAVGLLIAAVSLVTTYFLVELARVFPNWGGYIGSIDSATASHLNVIWQTPPTLVLVLAALMFAWSLLLASFVNVNVLSARHAFRHWLKGAYLKPEDDEVDGGIRNNYPRAGVSPDNRPAKLAPPAPLRPDFPLRDLHPWLLRPRDFVDEETGEDMFPLFLHRLNESNDAVSEYLLRLMPGIVHEKGGRPAGLKYFESSPDARAVFKRDVIETLNRVLEGEDFIRFFLKGSHIPPSVEVGRALSAYYKTRRDSYLILTNRLLLRLTYPQVFREVQVSDVLAWQHPMYSKGVAYALMPVFNISRKVSRRERYAFTASPLHAGGVESGYRHAGEYGGPDGLTLATAAALSANPHVAPASPRPPLATRILYTLLNVRQGWWLANPDAADGDKLSVKRAEPTLFRLLSQSIWPRRREDDGDYVNLSGGDEFDPLGVYQMVLRRCGVIVVVDGNEDASHRFEALGDCLRRVRLDLGVPIFFDEPRLLGGAEGSAARHCAVGRVLYSVVDGEAEDGVFVYVRPALAGGEPREVLSFAKTHADFPEKGSSGVLFTEDEFESYRALGAHAVAVMCGGAGARESLERKTLGAVPEALSLNSFVELVGDYVSKPSESLTESSYYDTRGAASPTVERKLEKLIEMVGRPVLYNYEGVLCAEILSAGRDGGRRWLREGGGLSPGELYSLEVWLSPAPPVGVLYEVVSVRNGETAESVEFEVTVKSSTVRFERGGEMLTTPAHDTSQRLQFYFTAPEAGETQEVFVRLLQMNRLVQVLRVPVETLEAGASREGRAT